LVNLFWDEELGIMEVIVAVGAFVALFTLWVLLPKNLPKK